MMKGYCWLNQCLEEKFLVLRNRAHPSFFPGVVRRMELAGIVEIDARDVFDRIRNDVLVRVRRRVALHYVIVTDEAATMQRTPQAGCLRSNMPTLLIWPWGSSLRARARVTAAESVW